MKGAPPSGGRRKTNKRVNPRKADEGFYKGLLAEPMPTWTALTKPSDDEVDQLIQERMKALLTHYSIDPHDAYSVGPKQASAWADLAFMLGRAHVPALKKAPRSRGRPAERKQDDVTLVLRIELLARRDGLKARPAVKRIVASGAISGSVDTLYSRYKTAKKKFALLNDMLNRASEMFGPQGLVSIMEDALSRVEKETISSHV